MSGKKYLNKLLGRKAGMVKEWKNMTLIMQQSLKKQYEELILNGDNNFPNKVNTKGTRISKLTDNQIKSILRFKSHYK